MISMIKKKALPRVLMMLKKKTLPRVLMMVKKKTLPRVLMMGLNSIIICFERLIKYLSKEVKPTLDQFGVWFIFHWISCALTTILLSAFIVQVIIDVIRFGTQTVDNMMPTFKVEMSV